MRTVNDISKITGVSVRTLHHYDAIGLLKPTKLTKSGYRLYDDAALSRLQSILMFRELQFPLKEIKAILDSPGFDPVEALSQQIKLLEMRQKHLGELIALAREIQNEGVNKMNFDAFNTKNFDKYADEVRQRWKNTSAYEQYQQNVGKKTQKELRYMESQLMTIFSQIGALRHLSVSDKAVQEKIKYLQRFITQNYYTCTDEILNGLSQMYVCDERIKKNIDEAGGEGTAEFVRKAIHFYCSKEI